MKNTTKLVYCAVFIALIFVATAFLKVPLLVGYAHLGDGAIFLAAFVLGVPGALAAAIGSALADLMLGYGIYAPVTFVIKGVMALIAYKLVKSKSLLNLTLTYCLCGGIMVLGYFAFESLLYGIPTAITTVLPNLLQAAFGVVLGTVLVRFFPPIPLAKTL